jgi:hypothetical protein
LEQFNLTPHQRSIENYGVGKWKSSGCCGSVFGSVRRNNDCDRNELITMLGGFVRASKISMSPQKLSIKAFAASLPE